MASEWDADAYGQVNAPQKEWAAELFERLHLNGDEVVLDAGCGSGNITAQLVELVPGGRVYGVDASANMAAHAGEALRGGATILHQDLTELELPEQVDLIFSNATFHWIHDHQLLFDRLFAALKPGGRLVAQCGGEGNIDSFRRIAVAVTETPPFAGHFTRQPWIYANAENTAQRLASAGFTGIETWLAPRPTTLEHPRPFVTTVCLLPHLQQLPEELREPFVDAVLAKCGSPLVLDYVRLNMVATRPLH